MSVIRNWQTKKLGELFEVKSSKRVHKADWRKSGVPFYRAREVVKLAENGRVENDLFIAPELYEKFTKEKGAPRSGDIIISAVGTLGQCYVVQASDKFYFKDASVLWFEQINDEVDSRFIEYAFKSDFILKQVMSKSMGATVATLTIARAKNIEISIPSLSEQERIVAFLDDFLKKLERAKENAEKNLKNAKKLFESYLQSVFVDQGKNWHERSLGDVCDFENGDRGKNYPNKSYRVSTGIPFINAGHLLDNKIDFAEMDYISEDRFNLLGNGKIKPNDILFCLRGSLGKVANVNSLDKGAVASSLVIIRSKKELNNDYLLYFLNSDLTTEQILDFGNGAAQPNLSAGNLKKFIISFPESLSEQRVIVAKLDELSIQTKKLEVIYKQKLADLEELKKSVLKRAFNGGL